MKVLIISYYFPPVGGAHSYRWSQIAEHWASLGYDVEIITSMSKERVSKNSAIILEEVGGAVSPTRFIKNRNGSLNESLGLKKYLKRLLVKVYRAFYWPDGLWYWTVPLLFKLYRKRNEKYDLVISYSPTFTAHVGCLFFKYIAKDKWLWVADYGDPFSISKSMQPNNFKIYAKLNRLVEKMIFKSASSVVFTNEDTLGAYRKEFGSSFKAKCIPHAVDVDLFYAGNIDRNKGKVIRLCYVGGFHKGIREPFLAVKKIKELSKLAARHDIQIVFDIYGPGNGIDMAALTDDTVFYHGAVDRESAVEHMRSADFLINIENVNCLMTPSKLVEYVATGLPIMNFVEEDVSELFCDELISQQVINVDSDLSSADMLSFIKLKYGCFPQRNEIKDMLSNYELGEVASRYVDCSGI